MLTIKLNVRVFIMMFVKLIYSALSLSNSNVRVWDLLVVLKGESESLSALTTFVVIIIFTMIMDFIK